MISSDPEIAISTLLGSCVACCLWDPVVKIGGMNHLLFRRRAANRGKFDIIGPNSMEVFINELLSSGAVQGRLQAKVFGGAKMIDGLSNIGAANAKFVLDFLSSEGIACVGKSLGGTAARHVLYWPYFGIARQKVQYDMKLLNTAQPLLHRLDI